MLVGSRVRLRSFELSDLDEIMKYWNDLELRNFIGHADMGPACRNDEEEWIKNTWKERRERRAFHFAVESMKENKLIGGAGLFHINWTSRSAMFGISIYNPKYRGKGYGVEATDLMLRFAFRILNLNRVELLVFDFNEKAQKCYLKAGFREVGRKRKAHFIKGQYHDEIIMDILREEWLAKERLNTPRVI